MKPLCFVLMPFGRKTDSSGRWIDFDAVYRDVIQPAVTAAGLEAIRADEEQVGGTIHKPMYERLMLCEYAVADVTGANPNVYYELGIRHALRPRSTVILFAQGTALPFDIALLRGSPYRLGESGIPTHAEEDSSAVERRLKNAFDEPHDDSPIFALVDDMPRFEIDHLKTDLFRDRIASTKAVKMRLERARSIGGGAVSEIAAEMPDLRQVEAAVVVDLFLSFRAVEDFQGMVDLHDRMSGPLQQTRIVREQLGFALNRIGRSVEAERVLLETIKKFGVSSETNGLLGRIYKDRWQAARKAGKRLEAKGMLKRAINAYRTGFEADWRDPYPGINLVTLMEMEEETDPSQAEILPVVRYAAKMRSGPDAGYWDHATLLELAVLARDEDAAEDACAAAITRVKEIKDPKSTANNLRMIREAREDRGENVSWIAEIEAALLNAKPVS